jgi:acid phosphatase (class A)
VNIAHQINLFNLSQKKGDQRMNRLHKAARYSALLWVIIFSLLCAGEKPYAQMPYLDSGEINLTKLLAPPPPQNSDQTKKELEEILQYQKNRDSAAITRAVADQMVSISRFASVLGPKFNEKDLPITAAFFDKILDNAKLIVDPSKDFWKRPRPYIFDTLVKPCLDKPTNASYPSGHSSLGNLFTIILANMVPEKNAEIFNRGWEFALNRVIGGVHYRSDIEAGRIAATVIAAELFKNKKFITDFNKAKAEVRKTLGFKN